MASDQSDTFFGANAFMRMWTDYASKMSEMGLSGTSQPTAPEAIRQLRTTMLRTWSEYCNQFMRTDEFLGMMKQSLDGAIQARRQINDVLGEAQHACQGATRQDLDKVMSALERLERRLADDNDAIDARLDEMGERLAHVERAAAPNGTNGAGKRKRSPSEQTQLEAQPES